MQRSAMVVPTARKILVDNKKGNAKKPIEIMTRGRVLRPQPQRAIASVTTARKAMAIGTRQSNSRNCIDRKCDDRVGLSENSGDGSNRASMAEEVNAVGNAEGKTGPL